MNHRQFQSVSVFSANSITLSNSSSEFLVGTETSVQLCVQDETELFHGLFLTGKTSPAFPFFLHSEKNNTPMFFCARRMGATGSWVGGALQNTMWVGLRGPKGGHRPP